MAGSLQMIRMMKRLIPLLPAVLVILLSLQGCQPAAAQKQQVEIRTVENSAVNSIPIEAPPMITEQATELRPPDKLGPDGKPIKQPAATPSPEGEAEQPIMMPFAPLIAMDPVDGSKVSIRVGTPVTEYNDRFYYFSSPANKATFLADPKTYATGSLSKY
jgi:YHS domain-containing protein